MLAVMFNINSSSRRQEYSNTVTVRAHYVTTVYNYTRTKVSCFYEQIWQLTVRQKSWTTNNCRFYCDNL